MKNSLAVVICLLLLPFSHAQDNSDKEVFVLDDMSKSEVKKHIVKVEDDVYRVFNANNSTDEFDINCRMEKPTGTYIPQRVCQPEFLAKAQQRNTNDYLRGVDSQLSQEALMNEFTEEFEQVSAEYAQLYKENATFALLLDSLSALNARLAEF